MSDNTGECKSCDKLADEIERMRKDFTDLLRLAANDASKYQDEIDRLRGLLGDVQIILDSHNNIVGNLNGEITRLRGLLAEAPCTCQNPPPYDWPHDPNNEECYLNRVREALGE